MSTPEGSEHIQPGRLNKTAIAAIVLALVTVSGVWLFGAAVLAVFAVGAGHVALDQIKRKGEGGRWLAIGALCITYSLAVWALLSTLGYVPVLVQQMTQ
ncbi:hypothetical protein GCM10009813_20740 [Brevibacterium marinum]|uniref:DUF4190 domain-containing protein n=1 Tax=Brevibacterium marinum TaxID=418643 RepID=A0A846RUK7_9MICO|nr:hypothetical protein [Brevibacterium marinum]